MSRDAENFYKMGISNIFVLSYALTYSILLSTRQTAVVVRRQSDRKPSRLPFRLKELRTFACFPVSPHRGINYPPTYVGPPFLSRKELRFASFLFLSIRILIFYKEKFLFTPALLEDCTVPRIRSGFLLSKDKVLSLMATSLLNRNPYGFPINGSPVF